MNEFEILEYLKKIEPCAHDKKWYKLYKTLMTAVDKSCTTESIEVNGVTITFARRQGLSEQQGLDLKKSNIGRFIIFRLVLSGITRLLGIKIKSFITINSKTFESLKSLSAIEFNSYMLASIEAYYNSKVVKGHIRPKSYHPICDHCKHKGKMKDIDSGTGCLISIAPDRRSERLISKSEFYNLPVLRNLYGNTICPFEPILVNNGYLMPYTEHIKPQYLIPKRIYDNLNKFINCLTSDFIKVVDVVSENPVVSKRVKTASEGYMLRALNENAAVVFAREYLKFDPAMAIQISKYIEKYGTN